jgi:serine/threonine protein kinase
LTTSLTKRLSIVYNDRNEIEEKEEALEHSALPTEEPHPSINRRLSFAGEIVVSRKSSYGGELGF